VLDRYFTLEDPRRLEPAERELYVEALLESKLLLRGFVDRLDISAGGAIRVVDYKGLALDTPLPTPTGWTTMAEVEVGDRLFGIDGRPTTVTEKSTVHHRPCYRVRFRDGSSVVADNVHQWTVVSSQRQVQTTHTLDTDALARLVADQHERGRRQSVWIPAAQPLELHEAEPLPVDPWLLGAWLGDGDTRGGRITVGRGDLDDMVTLVKQHWSRDVRVRAEVTASSVCPTKINDLCPFGHALEVDPTPGHPTRRCRAQSQHAGEPAWNVGLTAELARLGVRGNKHIPLAYLRAGADQRIALLRGLMDTHGWWNKSRRRAGFSTTNDRLADDVVELLFSLGICPRHFRKPHVNPGRSDRTWHIVEFTPLEFNPFSLPRKAIMCDVVLSGLRHDLASRRIITAVERVGSVPTQCISVDSPDSLYLCGKSFVPTHNTGRSPGEWFEGKALFQMKFYALVIWRTRGVVPAMLQLVYLGNGEMLRYVPDEGDLLATERKVEALWRAIVRAQETGDWRPHRSRLCDWCSFQALCPEFGGTPPALPGRTGDPGELTAEDVD
jgi:hypothetical protein